MDCDKKYVKVWTIQPIEVWEKLSKEGIFRCDSSEWGFTKDFRKAYDWLVKQMDSRMVRPEGCEYPIWAWYRQDGLRCCVTDDEYDEVAQERANYVKLEVLVPADEILLSDFDAWHCVLNGSYSNKAETEEEYYALREQVDAIPYPDRLAVIEDSWQNIFDITPTECYPSDYVQGVFWELKKEDVACVSFLFKSKDEDA